MTTEMTQVEQDIRLGILNTLLTTPHRKLDEIYPVHQQMLTADPRFYGQLAAWYFATGEVRDHKEVFCICLCLSDYEGHRNVGLAMLRELPPYQVCRITDFIVGGKIKELDENEVQRWKAAVAQRKLRRARGPAPRIEPPKATIRNWGLWKNLPRSLKKEVKAYLKEREADQAWFDGAVLGARKHLKRLYALCQVRPSDRARAILFEKKPPEDSSAFMIKSLANATDATEQAKLIVEHKIPYRIASTVVLDMTAPIIAALISVMSDQEIINSVGSLSKRGVFNNPDLAALINEKLEKAKTGKRVAAFKGMEAAKAAQVSEEVKAKLEEVSNEQIKNKGRINRSTAILIDKSQSMQVAIELGKRIGSMISASIDAPLFVVAGDTIPYPVQAPASSDFASWEKAFHGISAAGWTSCGVGLEYLIRQKSKVEQIILITDEGENRPPYFWQTYNRYKDALCTDYPNVCIVKVRTPDTSNKLEREAAQLGFGCDVWEFSGDYYSLPNLLKFLQKPSKLDLLMEIMTWPLPQRKQAVAA